MLHSPSANLYKIAFPRGTPKHYATSLANIVLELPLNIIVYGLMNIIKIFLLNLVLFLISIDF